MQQRWLEIWGHMRAIPRVPWKDNEDTWYGPNAAVWGDASTAAALVGISSSLGVDLDQDSPCGEWTLAAEWRWLCAGHWPCMHPRPGALGMFQRCPTLGPRHLHARIDERTIEGRELR